MAPSKASRLDGFQASFYQTHLDIMGHFVCKFVRSSLSGMPLDPILNKTLLILIPKVQSLEKIT